MVTLSLSITIHTQQEGVMARGQLILDRYEPLGTAGAGGFGTVCIAWDQRIQRKVAIKTIELSEIDARRAMLPGADAVANAHDTAGGAAADSWRGIQPWSEYLAENGAPWPGEVREPHGRQEPPDANGNTWPDEPVTSLAHLPGLDEARTAAKLQDPRIVGVFDFEVRGQIAYLIMEYVEGITLTRVLTHYEDYLTLDVVAAVFDAVAGALSVAHKAGVLHLDIKPDNILINTEGQAKVTDFGLATLADASGTGLAGGGTIGYMPLEQMRREPLDARTDEWALASVTYEMLTGENPFRADSLPHAEAAIENAELVIPSLCWDDIDEQIDDVIFYALDPERDERYASVADFAEEARKFLGDPTQGEKQLAAIVKDALGLLGEQEDDGYADEERPADYDSASRRRDGNLSRMAKGAFDEIALRYQPFEWAQRAINAAVACYLGYFALGVIYPMAPLFGRDATFTTSLVCAIAVGVCGAVAPHVGILIAGVAAGFALIVAGQVAEGAVLAVVGLAWCYAFAQLARRDSRPVLLLVVAVACIAGLAASLYFPQTPQELMAPSVAAALAVLAQAISVLAKR